jgi:hypothetical protein
MNYAETKRIPLENATKQELIAAIRNQYAYPDVIRSYEIAIHQNRVQALLSGMKTIMVRIDASRERNEPTERRTKLHEEWLKINNQLAKLQGT